MARSIVGSRGRLTVPKDVRDRLGLRGGDQAPFGFEKDSVRLTIERRKIPKESRSALPANRQHPGKEGLREAARGHAVGRMLGKLEA